MSSWFCSVHEQLNTVYILYDSIRPASIPEKVKKEEEKKEEALKEEVKEAFGGGWLPFAQSALHTNLKPYSSFQNLANVGASAR